MGATSTKKLQQVAPSEVLDHLRHLIETTDMQPGERLPSERALALELRVGRPSIREAIKALQILDVLDGQARRRNLPQITGRTFGRLALPSGRRYREHRPHRVAGSAEDD